MNKRFAADLHLHTFWSYDALATPEQVFAAAQSHGLRAIAITEHLNIDSARDAAEVAQRFPGIRYIRAAELTVTTSIGAVDLLCYGFPQVIPPALQAVLDEYHDWQRRKALAIVRGMQKLGHDYTEVNHEALLKSYRPPETLALQGRTHVMNRLQCEEFVRRGFIREASEYSALMSAVHKAYREPYPAVEPVTKAVKAAGVLIVIAHPSGYFNGAEEKRMDALREECRFDGIECIHSSTKPELGELHRAYCVKKGLLSTGGSDSHTTEQHATLMGAFGTPDEWWTEFSARLPQQ